MYLDFTTKNYKKKNTNILKYLLIKHEIKGQETIFYHRIKGTTNIISTAQLILTMVCTCVKPYTKHLIKYQLDLSC